MSDTNKREYKITKSDLGYHVYRTRDNEGIEELEWLQRDTYTLNINHARTFYTINDATSALIIARRRGDVETPATHTTSIKKSESEGQGEKTSWSELS